MVLRWLSPGGIVLLDEPELHQHLSLMRGSLAVLHSLIAKEFNGQLLVASHAPEVWDHFKRERHDHRTRRRSAHMTSSMLARRSDVDRQVTLLHDRVLAGGAGRRPPQRHHPR
jgi:predicted ATPase